jgi:hypothetical protein
MVHTSRGRCSDLPSIVTEHFPKLQVMCAARSRDAYTLELDPLTVPRWVFRDRDQRRLGSRLAL